MTESAPALPAEVQGFVQAWAESFSQVLGQISGSATPCSFFAEAPPEPVPAGDGDLWIVCACSGGVRGEMSLRLPASGVLRLAQIFMSEPPFPAAEITPEHREAATELLRQVAGRVASALKPDWGEVQLRLDPAPAAPSWPASSTAWLRLGEESTPATLVELQLSAALGAGLRAGNAETARAGAATSSSGPVSDSSAATPSPLDGQVKLDLLMDVELAVTLRFGSRRLLLREVLELHPGAVVDLDRRVHDPVDVLLDGRLLARGEVVVLNGNYGVRVTELAPASSV
ncbi:MAG TPA: flagellar motor switch protein FliN [Terriglobales bacterium]|nr:flagellar motor switch protein FliN [Terriglobales bacterium]